MRRRLGLGAFAASLTLPVLALGGQHLPVLVLAAVLAGAAVLLLANEKAVPPALALALFGLAGYSALQLVPLPAALVRFLSPAAAAVWAEALKPFGEPAPRFMTLSVDPAATALEVLKWSTYACVAIAAASVREVRGASAVAALIFSASLAVFAVTFSHGLVDARRIYGLFPVIDAGERWTRGPLVDGNNLAGFMNLGVFAGAGLWMSKWLGRFRWVASVGVVLLASGVVLTGSRGGVLALGLGGMAFVLLAFRHRGEKAFVVLGTALLVFAVSATAVVALGDERLVRSLTDTGAHAKAVVWRWALPMLRDFPVFGVGRGAFETAFPPYRGSTARPLPNFYAHAENFVVDWVSEWGIPVGLAVLVGLGVLATRLFARARREPLAAGLAVAVGTLFFQNLADLGLEIFGVTAAAVAGVVAASEAPRTTPAGWQARLPLAAVGAAALACLVALSLRASPVQVERRRLRSELVALTTEPKAARAAFLEELHAAVRRHPGEAYFPLLGSAVARLDGGDPLPWLARALERGPRYGDVHLALADLMHAHHRVDQAFMHLRLAGSYDVTLEEAVMGRALRWASDFATLAKGFPAGAQGSELLKTLCERVAVADSLACWREVASRHPEDPRAQMRFAEALVATLDAAPPPDGSAAAGAREAEARRVVEGLTVSQQGWRASYLKARLRAHEGDAVGAIQALLAECPSNDAAEACLGLALDLAQRLRDAALLARVVERFVPAHCTSSGACAKAHERVAAAFAALDTWPRVVEHYSAAARAEPTAERWTRVAESATRAGAPTVAKTALVRAELIRSGHTQAASAPFATP